MLLKESIKKAEDFYDEVSDFYEKMIDFQKNLELRINAYQKIFNRKSSVADIGCGIGLDSIALALNGHNVTAFDISPQMINELNQNAAKYNVNISAYNHSFDSIPRNYKGKFNYVVSVGNTIAHLNSKQLKRATKKTYDLLCPGGKIIFHILNYDLILKKGKRINNIAVRDGKTIIRFYDFLEERLIFNILTFPKNNPKEFQLVSTKHFPHTKREIQKYLKAVGFNRIKCFKNFAGDKFQSRKAKDLFVEAIKEL